MPELKNDKLLKRQETLERIAVFLVAFLIVEYLKKKVPSLKNFPDLFQVVLSILLSIVDQFFKLPKRFKKIFDSFKNRFLEARKLKKVFKSYDFRKLYEIRYDEEAQKLLYAEWNNNFNKACEVRISGIAQFENLGKDYWKYKENSENRNFEGLLTRNFIANTSTNIKVLLLYPFELDLRAKEKVDRFIQERIDEINEGKKSEDFITMEKYRSDIVTTYEMIKELNKTRRAHKVKVVFYDCRPIFRYILFPEVCFFSPYLPGREGHETLVIECGEGKQTFYYSFSKAFDHSWDEYKDKFKENIT